VRSVITKEQCHRRSTARGSVQQTVDERLRVLTVAVRGLAEDGTDSADTHSLLIEHCGKLVLHGAGKQVVTLHQGKPSLVMSPPCGPQLCRVKLAVRVATQAFGRDRM
jgi:hypothetical protein